VKVKLLKIPFNNNGVKVFVSNKFYTTSRKIKILITKLDHLGDFILAIPAIMRLSKKFPGAEIDIIVGQWNASMAEKIDVFRNIFIYNYFSSNSFEAPDSSIDRENELFDALEKYDIAIDLRRQPETRFVMKKITATVKVGYRSFSELDGELDICLDSEQDEVAVTRKSNMMSNTLQLLRLVEAIPSEVIQLPELIDYKPVNKQIALFPFAGNGVKEWPLPYFIDLINKLKSDKIASAINIYIPAGKKIPGGSLDAVNIFSGLNTEELIASLAGNCLSVSNNSFGAHLSSYLGIPVIGIYGGHETVLEWAPPFNKNTIIYSDVSCCPCHIPEIKNCPYDLICLKQITPMFVFDVIKKQIQEKVNVKTNGHFSYIS
jgi:ADP-heptose:LPS heptosyltransferase